MKPIYIVTTTVVLLWAGGVFGALGERLFGTAVQLRTRTVRPINPMECAPSPNHSAVITLQQQPDGSVSAYCKRYPILQGQQR